MRKKMMIGFLLVVPVLVVGLLTQSGCEEIVTTMTDAQKIAAAEVQYAAFRTALEAGNTTEAFAVISENCRPSKDWIEYDIEKMLKDLAYTGISARVINASVLNPGGNHVSLDATETWWLEGLNNAVTVEVTMKRNSATYVFSLEADGVWRIIEYPKDVSTGIVLSMSAGISTIEAMMIVVTAEDANEDKTIDLSAAPVIVSGTPETDVFLNWTADAGGWTIIYHAPIAGSYTTTIDFATTQSAPYDEYTIPHKYTID